MKEERSRDPPHDPSQRYTPPLNASNATLLCHGCSDNQPLLTLSPRWLPLVVIFAVSRETLFGMNLSIISAMSGIVDPCALLENDDSAWIQRCSGDYTMVQYELLCLQSTSNVSFPPNDVILFASHLSLTSSFSRF